jgi:hypothetical protein
VFTVVFLVGSTADIWFIGPNTWRGDNGKPRNLRAWLASLPSPPPAEKVTYHPDNILRCVALIIISIGFGGITFRLLRGPRRDESLDDYRDGRHGVETDGRIAPKKPN